MARQLVCNFRSGKGRTCGASRRYGNDHLVFVRGMTPDQEAEAREAYHETEKGKASFWDFFYAFSLLAVNILLVVCSVVKVYDDWPNPRWYHVVMVAVYVAGSAVIACQIFMLIDDE